MLGRHMGQPCPSDGKRPVHIPMTNLYFGPQVLGHNTLYREGIDSYNDLCVLSSGAVRLLFEIEQGKERKDVQRLGHELWSIKYLSDQ